jgi:histone H3/H4
MAKKKSSAVAAASGAVRHRKLKDRAKLARVPARTGRKYLLCANWGRIAKANGSNDQALVVARDTEKQIDQVARRASDYVLATGHKTVTPQAVQHALRALGYNRIVIGKASALLVAATKKKKTDKAAKNGGDKDDAATEAGKPAAAAAASQPAAAAAAADEQLFDD